VAAAALDLRADGTLLITLAAERLKPLLDEMLVIASEPHSRNMLDTSSVSTVLNATDPVLNALCYATIREGTLLIKIH